MKISATIRTARASTMKQGARLPRRETIVARKQQGVGRGSDNLVYVCVVYELCRFFQTPTKNFGGINHAVVLGQHPQEFYAFIS